MAGEQEDPAGLTAEQVQAVQFFREVTANGRDERSSAQFLRACNWNVEQALQLHWAAPGDAGIMAPPHMPVLPDPLPPNENGVGLGMPLLNQGHATSATLIARPPRNSRSRFSRLRHTRLPGWLTKPLRYVGVHVCCCPPRCFSFLSRSRAARVGRRLQAPRATSLHRVLTTAYGADLQLPRFFEGSLSQALHKAQKDGKTLAVYLHNGTARHAQRFCKDTLTTDSVRTMLDENFLLLGLDIGQMEEQRLPQVFRAPEHPFFCVLAPAGGASQVRVGGSLHGDIQVDALVALLISCAEQVHAERIARSDKVIEDRLLRDYQNEEYQASLEADRQRAESKKAQEQQEQEVERLAQEERDRERSASDEQERQWTLVVEQRKRKAAVLEDEKPDAQSRISLRLPTGQRLQRRFCQTATLADVYIWAESAAYLAENEGKGLEVPQRFMLRTVFPSKDLTEMESSIADLQLSGTNLVLAEIEDD